MSSHYKKLLFATSVCGLLTVNVSFSKDFSISKETAALEKELSTYEELYEESLYTSVTRDSKTKAFLNANLCLISSNEISSSFFVDTMDLGGRISTETRCLKKDPANPKPVRYKVYDGLGGIKIDEKFEGARRNSKVGTFLEKHCGIDFNNFSKDLIAVLATTENKIDNLEETLEDCANNIIAIIDDEYKSPEEQMTEVDSVAKTEELNKIQKIVEWVHKHFHYLKETPENPIIAAYKKYSVMVFRLETEKELEGLLTHLENNIDEVTVEKPLITITINELRNIENLSRRNKTLLKKYFNVVPNTDRDICDHLERCNKSMMFYRKELSGAPQIKMSILQAFMKPVESLCQDFEYERLVPKIAYGAVYLSAALLAKRFIVDPYKGKFTKKQRNYAKETANNTSRIA